MTFQGKIRDYAPADFKAVDEIRAKAFAPIFAGFRAAVGAHIAAAAFAEAEAEQRELLETIADGNGLWDLWVAEAQGDILGFLSATYDQSTKLGEVGLNAVAPAFQGMGVGAALLDHACAAMRAKGMAFATVSTGGDAAHAPARALYEGAGFQSAIPGIHYYRAL